MTLYDNINLGIINRIWKRCSSTITTYPIKNVISDLNDALDWYFSIAFKAGKGWEVDDSNRTLPPLDTQNIVSGTNRYKFGAFTEKVINLIKLEALNDAGNGYSLIPEDINSLPASFEELYLNTNKAVGTPLYYVKYGDFIYLRPTPNYSETSGLKVLFNRPASKFEFIACSIANGASALTTLISGGVHGLVAGDSVLYQTLTTLNTGLTADTVYYVIAAGLTTTAFEVSATLGGSAVTTSSTGSNCYFLKLNIAPGIQETHHPHLITYVSKTFLTDNNPARLGTLLNDVLFAEKKIKEDYYDKEKDTRNIISMAPIRGGRGWR